MVGVRGWRARSGQVRQAQVALDGMAMQTQLAGNLLARHPRGGQRMNRLVAAANNVLHLLVGA